MTAGRDGLLFIAGLGVTISRLYFLNYFRGLIMEEVQVVNAESLAQITRGEIDMQVATAKRYPRDLTQVMKNIFTAGTYSEKTMQSLIYSLPQSGGAIAGPSVRLAEIIACEYGNLLIQSRVINETDREIVAQGVAWDMEKNVKVSVEVSRSIVSKYGKKFQESVIKNVKNAAVSIAYRNALFRIFPRAYIDSLLDKIQAHSSWPIEELQERKGKALDYVKKKGVPIENILNYLEVDSEDQIGVKQVNQLRYAVNTERDGEFTLTQIFTAPQAKTEEKAPEEKKADIKDKIAGNVKK